MLLFPVMSIVKRDKSMNKLYTLAEAIKITNVSRKLMHKLIEKKFVIPEYLAGQLFFSESEINKLKAMVEENKANPDTSKNNNMLHEFPSSSDFFPRDGRLLEETNDILFKLQILKNLSTQAHLVLYKNTINPSKFLYIIEENKITYTPISLDKTTVHNIYSTKSEHTKIEVLDICCKGVAHKKMRNFLAKYFYGSHSSCMKPCTFSPSMIVDKFPIQTPLLVKVATSITNLLSIIINRKKTFYEQQREQKAIFEQKSERETIYVMESSKIYVDLSYIRSKLSLPILELDDSRFSEALKNSFASINLDLFKRKMNEIKYDAICPIHGPVKVVVGGIISPAWTWKALCGRHWEFLLCPHCFFTFNTSLIRMN